MIKKFSGNKVIHCQKCGGEMVKTSTGKSALIGIAEALIVLILGIVILLLFFWTIIGAIIGIALIVASLFMGGKKKKIWRCLSCGYYFHRL